MNYKKLIILSLIVIIIIVISVIFLNSRSMGEKEIPKVYLEGNIDNMLVKEDKREIKVKYVDKNKSFTSNAMVKIQGGSSLNYPKKNYNITFYDDAFKDKKKYDVKWGEFSKYTLKSNFTDPLKSRNIVSARIGAQINKKYGLFKDTVNYGFIDGFPIEVYNNNEFLGFYTMNIHKDYLFNIDEDNKNNLAIEASTKSPATLMIENETEDWRSFEVDRGVQDKESLEKLNRLITFVGTSSDKEFKEDFDKYLNLDSVLNYYCYMKFAGLFDNIDRNIFLVTYDGKVWYTALYDLDISWGTSMLIGKLGDRTNIYDRQIKNSRLWSRVEKTFPNEIKKRYLELREDIFTKSNVKKQFNNFYKTIPDETLEKEYKKWHDEPKYKRSFINKYLNKRIPAIDKDINNLK